MVNSICAGGAVAQVSDDPVFRAPGAPLSPITDLVREAGPGPDDYLHVSLHHGLRMGWSASGPLLPRSGPARTAALVVKRAMDIALSLTALVVFSPLLLAIAVLVRLSTRGSVLFSQVRTGLGGRTFHAYKFRTMHVDLSDPTGRRQTLRGDSRVTAVGHFLRRYSIDELPQLINVLRGDMSIVGPRPHVPGMLAAGVAYEKLVPYYELRYTMKPGLSGWAQSHGLRGPTEDPLLARARIEHDIAYVQNFSLLLDLKIILMTLRSELTNGGGL